MSTYCSIIMTFLIGGSLLCSGCGSGEDNSCVSGKVTYNGQIVKTGMVFYEPNGWKSQVHGMPIKDGRYESPTKATIKPGNYTVRITAPNLTKSKLNPNTGPHDPVPEVVPLLPPSWNKQSKLNVELKAGNNTVNFSGQKMAMPQIEVAK